MVFNGTVLFVFICLVWLFALTFYVYRISSHYNKLVKGASGSGLKVVLENLLKQEYVASVKLEELEKNVRELTHVGTMHLSRIGIVRYNPFSDTGGSQSFSMALLDGMDTGIVVTSLFARSGNRWFVKEIEKGKSKNIELSKEEQSSIRKASA